MLLFVAFPRVSRSNSRRKLTQRRGPKTVLQHSRDLRRQSETVVALPLSNGLYYLCFYENSDKIARYSIFNKFQLFTLNENPQMKIPKLKHQTKQNQPDKTNCRLVTFTPCMFDVAH